MVIRSRVAFVGDATVGKSAIVQSFINGPNGFPKNYSMTQGCEIFTKPTKVLNRSIEYQIIDNSGQTMYRDITIDMVFYKQIQRSSIIVFVYDVTSQESFNSLQYWIKTVKDTFKDKLFYGFVVSNKNDITDRIVVRPHEGASFARSNKFEFLETSAVIFR
jgi:intraflagellar transport protein 27